MAGLIATGRSFPLRRASRALFRRTARAFTIVEVMIVLAVSGGMFVAAAILISGKQNQAAFNQAIQQIQSQIQQVMNEVSSGYFPGNANFQCSAGNGGPVNLTRIGTNAQGSNAGCIFAGKVLQFQVLGSDPEVYVVHTLAGAQKDSSGKEAQSLAATVPKVVSPGRSAPVNFPDISSDVILQNGLVTSGGRAGMWYNNGSGDVNIGAVAFVPSFASYNGSNLNPGAQQLSVVAIPNTRLNMAKKEAVDAINANITTGIADPLNGVSICFASGGTNQSGLVTIGGGGHPLSVTLKVVQGSQTCGR